MFRLLIRPLLRILSFEQGHRLVVWLLRIVGWIPGGRWLLGRCCAVEDPSLEREVFGVRFRNPIGAAAGIDRNGEIFNELGAIGFVHQQAQLARAFVLQHLQDQLHRDRIAGHRKGAPAVDGGIVPLAAGTGVPNGKDRIPRDAVGCTVVRQHNSNLLAHIVLLGMQQGYDIPRREI